MATSSRGSPDFREEVEEVVVLGLRQVAEEEEEEAEQENSFCFLQEEEETQETETAGCPQAAIWVWSSLQGGRVGLWGSRCD